MLTNPFFVNRFRCGLLFIVGTVVSVSTTWLFARQPPAMNAQAFSYSPNMDNGMTDTTNKSITNGAAIVSKSLHQIIFSAELQSGGSTRLLWKCADKIPILYYELQRSRDSSSFTPILLMHAKNGARNANVYQFTDNAMPAGACYYRLRIEDMDGKVTYSPVIPCFNQQANSVAQRR